MSDIKLTIKILSYRIPVISMVDRIFDTRYGSEGDELPCSKTCKFRSFLSGRPCGKKYAEEQPVCLESVSNYCNKILDDCPGIFTSTTPFMVVSGGVEWDMTADGFTMHVRVENGKAKSYTRSNR